MTTFYLIRSKTEYRHRPSDTNIVYHAGAYLANSGGMKDGFENAKFYSSERLAMNAWRSNSAVPNIDFGPNFEVVTVQVQEPA